MKIINGRWQDDRGEPVTEQNYSKLKKIGDNLSTLYGKNITYSRIELVSNITSEFARVAVKLTSGTVQDWHYPTEMIIEQLEELDKPVDMNEIFLKIKNLIT